MNEKVLVILETDPETGMRLVQDDYRKACAVEQHQIDHWQRCREAWEACQDEMAAIFKKNGGRHFGDPLPDDSEANPGSEQ